MQANELKLPCISVGVNVEAEKDHFKVDTKGMCDYFTTGQTYCRGVEYNDLTQPFIQRYVERFGETPGSTADTYGAIYLLKKAIEKTNGLSADEIVSALEKMDTEIPSGRVVFTKNHDLTWGPGYKVGIGVQWQNGEQKGIWPNNWEGITYKGIVPLKLPPWMIEKYQNK
jgi:branched-chain amino acid transport system substrate-binding protein